jgi:hypothetical protein
VRSSVQKQRFRKFLMCEHRAQNSSQSCFNKRVSFSTFIRCCNKFEAMLLLAVCHPDRCVTPILIRTHWRRIIPTVFQTRVVRTLKALYPSICMYVCVCLCMYGSTRETVNDLCPNFVWATKTRTFRFYWVDNNNITDEQTCELEAPNKMDYYTAFQLRWDAT